VLFLTKRGNQGAQKGGEKSGERRLFVLEGTILFVSRGGGESPSLYSSPTGPYLYEKDETGKGFLRFIPVPIGEDVFPMGLPVTEMEGFSPPPRGSVLRKAWGGDKSPYSTDDVEEEPSSLTPLGDKGTVYLVQGTGKWRGG